MKIDIQFVQMPTSESMANYTLHKLENIAKKYSWLIHTEVFFKKENDPKGKGKICEMELSLPGPRIYASSNEKNFELAVKGTIKDMERQIKKRKAEMKPHM
ncbi:HPF/RaiA family ribosome-associated protein [Urechidicola croceus]|uniref:30S ribosomal protein S30 n=1 Tax=Urechidicola croceus TaxID=1850246 RepID=A0A1D8P7X7_9FLAO|nr:HPF/RaiA family ribosome-associated protein [Urechidicola croceus]AOW20672.1 30S ribosomal protein S30 [Urechidicola croceus]